MKLSTRSYLIFFAALMAATYGAGQIWRLVTDVRSGSAGSLDMAVAGVGTVLLVASAVVLARFLYVIGNSSRSTRAQQQEELSGDVRNNNNDIRN